MPVYLATAHAYRSWREDNPRGYVQHDRGLQEPNANLALARDAAARFPPIRFSLPQQTALHDLAPAIAAELRFGARLHAAATCPTHLHDLLSFVGPACTCGGRERCLPDCLAAQHAEGLVIRLKQKRGQRLAKDAGTLGRPYFSRGWDLTPVRDRPHFDFLVREYLPDHAKTQGGIFRVYDVG